MINGRSFFHNVSANNKGGALLLLVVLFIAVGLVAYGAVSLHVMLEGGQAHTVNNNRLATLRDALIQYYAGHGNLPDPVNGASDGDALWGEVPVKALGLEQKYRLDPWGQLVVYRLNHETGGGSDTDIDGLTINTTTAAAVLVSTGPDMILNSTAVQSSSTNFTIDSKDVYEIAILRGEGTYNVQEELDSLSKKVWAYECANPGTLGATNPWITLQAAFSLNIDLQIDPWNNRYGWYYDGAGVSKGEFYSFGPNETDDSRTGDDILFTRKEIPCPGSGPPPVTNINGTPNDDVLVGTSGVDDIGAGRGDDTITGGAGDDIISGGQGNDTAIFSGNYSQYTITTVGANTTVSGPDGTDTLRFVEYLQFDDQTITL